MKVEEEIAVLESFVGFKMKRDDLDPKSKKSYDEIFSYLTALRFNGKEEDVSLAIKKTTHILSVLIQKSGDKKKISLFFSFLGNLYYIQGNAKESVGCFMKALSNNKNDLTIWIELMFGLRSLGEFEIFEKIIFNLESIFYDWKDASETQMNKDQLLKILSKYSQLN